MLIRVVAYAIMAYVAFAAMIFFLQRRLLYLPSTDTPSESAVDAVGRKYWPALDNDYRGFIGAGYNEPAKGTVLIFHGNAGAAVDRLYYVHALQPLGYRVLLMEYPGYGGRVGQPSETTWTQDAKRSIQLAYQAFGPPLFLWGESLGSGVVAAAASDATLPVTAMILLTPWDSLSRLAQTLYWYLPARWLVRDKFDSVQNLQAFHGRVAVVVAEHDDIIPIAHGLRLYESISSPKKLWRFRHAGHNSWPLQPTESWWREVMNFVTEGVERDGG